MWRKIFGIDTFSYYHKLTSKQEHDIIKRLKKLPEFDVVISDYRENSYTYRSDCFADEGVRIWVKQENGNPWGLWIVVHPMLVLDEVNFDVLYFPEDKSEYQDIVKTVDKLLKDVNIPCSVHKMKLYRVDTAVDLCLNKCDSPDEYIGILKKSILLPHYKLDYFRKDEFKAKDCKRANKYSYKQYCSSAAFFAYDKTAQKEMIDAFPAALMDAHTIRLEAQLWRNGMRKWVEKGDMDGSNWGILKTLGQSAEAILTWYMERLQPVEMDYFHYLDAVDMIDNAKGKKNREQMLYLLRKTNDSKSLTTALEKLREKYDLSKGQCSAVLRKFYKLGINPITLTDSSDYETLISLPEVLHLLF